MGGPQLCRYGPLDSLHVFKMGLLADSLELEEKKKKKDIRGCSSSTSFFFLLTKELSHGVVSSCIVEVKQPSFVLLQQHVKKKMKCLQKLRLQLLDISQDIILVDNPIRLSIFRP